MTTATFSRGCHQLAMDILAEEDGISLDRVSDLAADLESFAADWVQTEKLKLQLENLRRTVGLGTRVETPEEKAFNDEMEAMCSTDTYPTSSGASPPRA